MRQSGENVRQTVRRLTTAGNFVEAEVAVLRDNQRRQADFSDALESLAKDAATEWNALQRAKAESRLQAQERATASEEAHFQHLLAEQSQRCQRSEDDLARFSAAEKERINATPLNVPWAALTLKNQESRFILQGSFAAAAKSRRDAARAEHEHCRASFVERSELLDRRVSRRAHSLLVKEAGAVAKDELSVTILQQKHAAEQQRTIAQVRHVEDGMLAAQRRAQRGIIKMREATTVSRATTAAAHRGAALERRVYGDAYRVPSLCASYGPLLEQPRPASALPTL